MKRSISTLLLITLLFSCSDSTKNSKSEEPIITPPTETKDSNGMLLTAPEETKQYLFKLGSWNLKTKYHNGTGLSNSTGTSKVYFAEDGLTYIEEMSLKFGGSTSKSKATFKYNIITKEWDNTYTDSGNTTTFSAKIKNDILTEFVSGTDASGSYQSEYYYEKISNTGYSYRENRVYSNSTSIMTWYFDAIKVQ